MASLCTPGWRLSAGCSFIGAWAGVGEAEELAILGVFTRLTLVAYGTPAPPGPGG